MSSLSSPKTAASGNTTAPSAAESTAQPTGQSAARHDRHERLVDAAIALAQQGGYDAVQMRDVAREASVAIGTLYRYVGSKDELLLICLERYIELARELVASEPNKTDTLESIERRLRDSAGLLSESPNLCSAFVTALVSTDPATASVKDRISEATAPLLADALGTTDPAAIRILGHVFYSALVRSVGGENIDIGDEVAAVAVALNLGSD